MALPVAVNDGMEKQMEINLEHGKGMTPAMLLGNR